MSYIMMGLGWILRLCSQLTGNYGVAVIIFTIIIKAVLMPLTLKQQRSMLRMQKVQPLMNDLQKKYGNDKDKLNQEMMKLYKKYDVNPASGCLPMLIQLPILMMLYWVVKKPVVYIMGFGEGDVWRIVSAVTEWSDGSPEKMNMFLSMVGIDSIDKLTADAYKMFGQYEIQIARFLHAVPDVMNNHWITESGKNYVVINFSFLGMDLSQTPNLGAFAGLFLGRINNLDLSTVLLWSIPLLSGVSAYATSKISQAQNPTQQQTNENGEPMANSMKSMMIIMPFMSAWFAFTLPSAVGLHWIVSNIIAILQQLILAKIIDPGITEEQIEGEIVNAKKNRKKRKK